MDNCIQTLLDSDADLVLCVKPAERNPYFNMVVLDSAGYARLVIPPPQEVSRRQDAPAVYDVTTVAYAARPDFVLHARGIFDGKVRAVLVPAERAQDLGHRTRLPHRRVSDISIETAVRSMRSLRQLMDLHGRVALITGGAGHIGMAMAEALAELGAGIALVDIAAATEARCR